MARIREVKTIGACTSTLEKNIISLVPKSKGEDKFGAEFVCNPDPRIATSGGFVDIKFRKTPSHIRVSCLDGTPIEVERINHPLRIVLPKRTVGFDPRAIQVSVHWNSSDGEMINFETISEVSEEIINPILYNFGRGMRDDGKPEIISHSMKMGGIEYTPLRFFKNNVPFNFRDYDDKSIHVDKMGPFTYRKIKTASTNGIHLNYLKVDVGSWEGVKRNKDGVAVTTIQLDGEKITAISPATLCNDILKLCSRFHQENSLSDKDRKLLEKNIETLIDLQGEDYIWKHPFPLVHQGIQIERDWTSAALQGLVASSLIRASIVLKNKTLIMLAEQSIRKMLELPEMSHTLLNARIFQEHPTGVPVSSLSGHLYSVIGIADVAEVKSNKEWKRIFNDAIKDTETLLPMFDVHSSTLYDLSHLFLDTAPCLAKPQYHATHINQVQWLALRSESSKLSAIASRWESYFTEYPKSKNT